MFCLKIKLVLRKVKCTIIVIRKKRKPKLSNLFLSFKDRCFSTCKIHSRSRLAGVEATPKGTRVAREIAVHVVGSEKPALLYSMILLYQPPRGRA